MCELCTTHAGPGHKQRTLVSTHDGWFAEDQRVWEPTVIIEGLSKQTLGEFRTLNKTVVKLQAQQSVLSTSPHA